MSEQIVSFPASTVDRPSVVFFSSFLEHAVKTNVQTIVSEIIVNIFHCTP